MAVTGHHDEDHRHVSPELVREHAAGWIAFTKFMKYGTGATIAVLVLMAIFLL